jgi:tetratricopeptide (TPR) repeat protein
LNSMSITNRRATDALTQEIIVQKIPMITAEEKKEEIIAILAKDETKEEIAESAEEEFQRQIAEDAFDKGMEHWTSADMENALECFQNSLDLRESLFGTYHSDTAKSYLWVGAVQWNLGNHVKSLDTFCRSYRIKISLANGDPSECGIVNNWIKRVLDDAFDQGMLEDKTEYLTLFKSSITHERKGDLFAKEGRRSDAIDEYRSALTLEQLRRMCLMKGASPSDATMTTSFHLSESPLIDVADLQSKIGSMYALEGEHDRAMLQYRKALSIYMTKFGKTHPFTTATYKQIATICRKKGWSDCATNEYLAVIYTSILHEKTGDMLADRKGYSSALREYQAALACEESCSVGKLQLPSANIYVKVAKIHLQHHNSPDLALPYYCRALGIYDMAFGSTNRDTASTAKAIRAILSNTDIPTTTYDAMADGSDDLKKRSKAEPEHGDGLGKKEPHTEEICDEALQEGNILEQKVSKKQVRLGKSRSGQEKEKTVQEERGDKESANGNKDYDEYDQEEEDEELELIGTVLLDMDEEKESKSFDKYQVYKSFWVGTKNEVDPFSGSLEEPAQYDEEADCAMSFSTQSDQFYKVGDKQDDTFERARQELQEQQQGPLEMKQIVAKYTSQSGNKMDLDRPFQLSEIQSRPE